LVALTLGAGLGSATSTATVLTLVRFGFAAAGSVASVTGAPISAARSAFLALPRFGAAALLPVLSVFKFVSGVLRFFFFAMLLLFHDVLNSPDRYKYPVRTVI